jgi:chromosome segregation ATPase
MPDRVQDQISEQLGEEIAPGEVAVLSLAERREIELKIARMRAANETLSTEIDTLEADIQRAEDEISRLTQEKERIANAMRTEGEIVVAAKEAETAELFAHVEHLRARVRALEKLAASYPPKQAELRARLVRLEPVGHAYRGYDASLMGNEEHKR